MPATYTITLTDLQIEGLQKVLDNQQTDLTLAQFVDSLIFDVANKGAEIIVRQHAYTIVKAVLNSSNAAEMATAITNASQETTTEAVNAMATILGVNASGTTV